MAAVISVRPIKSEPMYGPNNLKCQLISGLLATSGIIPSAPAAVILYDPAQRSITIMPMLVIRKGILRSLIQAANFVKLLSAFFERSAEESGSCLSALIACPDVT